MKQLLFSLLLLISFCGFGQTNKFTFKAGTAYDLPRKAEDLIFFGNKKDGIVNLSLTKNELNILRFDPETLEKTYEGTKELPEITRNFNGEIPLEFGGSHYWLHSDWDKDAEKEYLFYDKVDVTTGNFLERDIKMIDASKISGSSGTGSMFSFKATGKYEFRGDVDNKKLLINYKLYPKERNNKKNYDVIGMYVFDENLKKIWNNEYTFTSTEQMTDIFDYSIDAKGNVFVLAKIFETEKRYYKDPKTDKPAYHLEIFRFTKENKSPDIIKLELGDYFIKEARLRENTAHEMIVSCTYSKKSPPLGTDGIFMAVIDNKGQLKKYEDGFYEFPLSELMKYESSKTRRKMEKKDDYEPKDIHVRAMLPVADGGILVTMEEYRVVTGDHKPGERSYTTYYYNDIYSMKIDRKGKMEWFTKIPKKQLGTDGYETLGFNLMSDQTNFYFLYVDNKKNIDMDEDEGPKPHINGYGGRIVVAKIDAAGKLTREILFNPFEEKMMILPTTFTSIDGNRFLGRAMLFKGGYRPVLISAN